MKVKTKSLSSAVSTALSIGAILVIGAPASVFAQDTGTVPSGSNRQAEPRPDQIKTTTLKSVVVTGSHIRRVDLETANPVISVGRVAIEATGDLTLGALVRDLPAMTSGATNPQLNNSGGEGSSAVSLRGLGPNRTLVLLDGHRIISGDVDSIPTAMIERIDVLKDGASAIYGSDAIGGVVNFITKKAYQGAQFTANYGESAHSDGKTDGYTFTFGQISDKGSIIAGVGYNKINGILGADRKFTQKAISLGGNPPEPFHSGSNSAAYGHIQIPTSGPVRQAFAGCASDFLARNPAASGADPINDYHCFQNTGPNSDRYDYAPINWITVPQERTNAFALGTYDLGADVSAYLSTYYNKTRSGFQLSPTPYGAPNSIAANNYYNPFGIAYGGGVGASYGARLASLGGRIVDFGTSTVQISTGFKGAFTVLDHGWNWDVGMDYGHISQGSVQLNLPDSTLLYTGPSFLDSTTGQVTCGTPGNPISGCDASFDPFNLQAAASVKALQKAAAAAVSHKYSQEKIWRADVNGGLFNVPAGEVQLALGANYRQEHTNYLADSLLEINPDTGSCVLGTLCSSNLEGGFNAKEGYGEVFIPILSNMPWAYGLNVTVGDRYSRFSTFGSTNNKEFKVEWRPIKDLLLRGTVAEVFRAPNVVEVFGAPTSQAPGLTNDPCDGYTGNPVSPACANVPTDGTFRNRTVAQQGQVGVVSAGSNYANFPIKPESGKSFDVGAVYSPEWVQGLSVSLDVWHVYLNNVITQVGVQSVLNLCSAGHTIFCSFIHRYPSGPQQGQINPLTTEPTGNLGSTNTGGVDLSADYKLDTASVGQFSLNINATYLKYYNQQTAPGSPENVTFHNAGHFMGFGSAQASACPNMDECLYSRLRGNGTVLWNLGNWRASWKVRYISGFRMGSPSPSQDTHPAGGGLDGFFIDYGSRTYNDIAVGYNLTGLKTRIDFGVNNLFDQQAPMLYQNNTLNSATDVRNFDLIGRYYWSRLTVSF